MSFIRQRRTTAMLAAVGAAVAVGASASGASAATPPGHCKGSAVTGQGSSLQNLAQGGIWIPAFHDNSNANNDTTLGTARGIGCGDATGPFGDGTNTPEPITYNSTSSGTGLTAWCANAASGCTLSAQRYIGTDDPPTQTQIDNMNNAGGGTANGQSLHTIPVAEAAPAFIIHLPANCKVPAQERVLNTDLSAVWAGNETWQQIFPDATGTDCSQSPLREVRSKTSGTTYLWQTYLNQIDPATWSSFQSQRGAVAWPGTQGTAGGNWTTGPTSNPNGGGGTLAANVSNTAGTIGYVNLGDATNNNFTRVPTTALSGTGQVFWTKIQSNGTGTDRTTATFADPASDDGLGQANCFSTTYTGVPAGTDPTTGDWENVVGSNPVQANTQNYPICGLTYQLEFGKYSLAFGNTQTEANAFQTVSDYGRWVTDPNHTTGGVFKIKKDGYTHVPGQLLGIANKGAQNVAF